MVVVHTQPGCYQCVATHRRLTERGVEFEVVDVSVDPEALTRIKELGYSQVPVVIAGDAHWSGFDPDRIDALVA